MRATEPQGGRLATERKKDLIAPGGIRTHNPSVKYRVLYSLSYRGEGRDG
jgi:hypothetical protein